MAFLHKSYCAVWLNTTFYLEKERKTGMYTQRNMLRAVVCIKIEIRVVCIEVEGESDCIKAWPRGCIQLPGMLFIS